jgi:hypothetical protein
MTLKKLVKAFLAGMAFPALFLPLAYSVLFLLEPRVMRGHSLQFIPMYIPIIFGITNVLYIKMHDGSTGGNVNFSLWVTGACLGLIVALFGVFVLDVPALVFGLNHGLQYAPLVVLPLVYGLIFRFIVKWINKLLAI